MSNNLLFNLRQNIASFIRKIDNVIFHIKFHFIKKGPDGKPDPDSIGELLFPALPNGEKYNFNDVELYSAYDKICKKLKIESSTTNFSTLIAKFVQFKFETEEEADFFIKVLESSNKHRVVYDTMITLKDISPDRAAFVYPGGLEAFEIWLRSQDLRSTEQ